MKTVNKLWTSWMCSLVLHRMALSTSLPPQPRQPATSFAGGTASYEEILLWNLCKNFQVCSIDPSPIQVRSLSPLAPFCGDSLSIIYQHLHQLGLSWVLKLPWGAHYLYWSWAWQHPIFLLWPGPLLKCHFWCLQLWPYFDFCPGSYHSCWRASAPWSGGSE